jgi:hypothetical protein
MTHAAPMSAPLRACPFCHGGRFVVLPGASIELSLHGTNTRTTNLRGVSTVCSGCGRVEFFVAQPEAWLAAMLASGHVRQLDAPHPTLVSIEPGRG